MRVLLQRVASASVSIEDREVARIDRGLLIFFCAMRGDTEAEAVELAQKTLKLRIFADAEKPMNRSVQDVSGETLVVPQFTLAAETKKGNRPSFHLAENPTGAKLLYEVYVDRLKESVRVSTGVFGANMQVELVNDGPVTLLLSPA